MALTPSSFLHGVDRPWALGNPPTIGLTEVFVQGASWCAPAGALASARGPHASAHGAVPSARTASVRTASAQRPAGAPAGTAPGALATNF